MANTQQDVQPVPNFPEFERVVDGWFDNFNLRPLCQTYLPLALAHDMLEVRAAIGDRRPRYHIVPSTPGVTVLPTGFFEENVSIVPGTLIWGIGIAHANDEELVVNLSNYSFRITDLQTGLELFSEFVGLRSYSLTDGDGLPHVLAQPITILAPGMVLVEIGAQDQSVVAAAGVIAFQLILFCSEPAKTCDPGPGVRRIEEGG